MLASDEDAGTLDALKFSLASDIIELVVLTSDDAFLQTLREAVGGARRLWHVPSPDKVSDLLVAGEVGIVVLDVETLRDNARVFVEQIIYTPAGGAPFDVWMVYDEANKDLDFYAQSKCSHCSDHKRQ